MDSPIYTQNWVTSEDPKLGIVSLQALYMRLTVVYSSPTKRNFKKISREKQLNAVVLRCGSSHHPHQLSGPYILTPAAPDAATSALRWLRRTERISSTAGVYYPSLFPDLVKFSNSDFGFFLVYELENRTFIWVLLEFSPVVPNFQSVPFH